MAGAATVEKAIDVLFHLHGAESALGLGEIARALGLAKSSCHRLLASLAVRDLVEQDESGRYRPGLALLSLGLGVQRREPVVAARPGLPRGRGRGARRDGLPRRRAAAGPCVSSTSARGADSCARHRGWAT